MKKFLKSKLNIFLLFLLTIAGGFSIILNVEATTDGLTNQDGEKDGSLLLDVRKLVDLSEGNTVSGLPEYALRSSDDMPLGYVDSTFIRCFVEMGPVSFHPQYKYKEVGGTSATNSLYGFSIPLVGDLNGDGKPEIIALGNYSTAGVNGYVEDLCIFNGQTGEIIVRYALPARIYPVISGYHGSPSQLALVDADRNGRAEIIVCFSHFPTTSYSKQIISYEINNNTFKANVSVNSASKLTQKWMSNVRYDASGTSNSTTSTHNYDYPLPQVVDIDADGTPEVIVYNKIYNALTGRFIMKFEDLGTSVDNKTANIGSSGNEAHYYEEYLCFPMIYDIDGDGKYDFIAGGKIYYDINLSNKTYKKLNYSSVKDGRTAVADINGDGKPEVIVSNYSDRSGTHGTLQLTVWSPDFSSKTGKILATRSLSVLDSHSQGNHSYLFIGDIDGKEQNGKKLPEISFLTGRPFLTSGYNMSNIPVHPNVKDGGISSSKSLTTGSDGAIVAFTWDNSPKVSASERLKVSFMMEHDDRSINTGFTLFDFDNDGIQDLCYRDERTLRIISATKSYVSQNESSSKVIRFKTDVWSFTGYEYPVIADIDGDASADMIVMGRSSGGTDNARGFIFAVEGRNRDLAPAPKVWNQFMYYPLRINEDLTTPLKTYDPLDPEFSYYKKETDTEPTFVYNNTITQVPIFSVFEKNGKRIMKPIVRTPDAKVVDLQIRVSAKQLKYTIENTGDATLNASIPIRIYRDGVLFNTSSIGSGGIFAGESNDYTITITDPFATYHVVVGGKLNNNELVPDSGINDCNWADNMDMIATFLPKNDAVTAIQYETTVIDVLKNDILQSECSLQILEANMITTPGGTGVMSGDFGSLEIIGNKLLYTAPKSYPDGVVKLSYQLTCSGVKKSANVYIYVIESATSGFASCAGSSYTVNLNEIPAGIKFDWFDSSDKYIGNNSPNIPNLTTDVTYYVKPVFGSVADSPYMTVQFPKAKLTIKALSASGDLKEKWTGVVDHDWNNPNNWVQVLTNKSEVPALWAPRSCVDVVIPNDAERYPELTSVAECGAIHMENRAMISGIHHLVYAEASVDFTPVPSEKNRFVMWSAPLKDVYTGDYHFLTSSGQPDWGHVYMNFFQSANPDYSGSVEKEKTFTATFGSTGTPLPLGKAFNVKVMVGKDGSFTFPKTATSYTDANNGNSGTLSRTNARRFITDGLLNESGELNLPVSGNNTYGLIQVVNPFMAYLKVSELLAANSSLLENSYSIWNGDVNADFISVLSYEDEKEHRYVIDNINGLSFESTGYIAPLQSFFVKKRTASTSVTALTMNTSMTTTSIPGKDDSYVLRSAVRGGETANLLRVTASSGNTENSTVMLRKSGAQQDYNSTEDVGKAFNHGVPVSVYTMTEDKKALAINTSENFKGDVKLGLRIRGANSPLTLSFTGLSDFGQDVSLIDHAQNDKVIDLKKESSYVFAVQTEGAKDVTEINDRFSLRFGEGSPTGIEIIESNINVIGGKNKIDVSSNLIFNRVEIMNISGIRIYDNTIPTSYCQIPVTGPQVYLVRVTVGGKQFVKKVFVK